MNLIVLGLEIYTYVMGWGIDRKHIQQKDIVYMVLVNNLENVFISRTRRILYFVHIGIVVSSIINTPLHER